MVDSLISNLALRERYRDAYWQKRDPIINDRLLWRAQTFRHTVHFLPGQTILELGCGCFEFTQALLKVSRGENPITAVSFNEVHNQTKVEFPQVERIQLTEFPGALAGRQFHYIVAMDLLDRTTSSALLQRTYELLLPGGEIVFYESNPWNPVYQLRAAVRKIFGRRDPRNLIQQPALYELLSDIGFIRAYAVFNDFVFSPLTSSLIWLLRNLSILLENAPAVRRLAGSILVHAQKPPRKVALPDVRFRADPELRGAISVVIPCRNEEMNVRPLIESILGLYGEFVYEIIPVNDGSTDSTGQVLETLAAGDERIRPIHRKAPNGVGLAIADGLSAAQGRYVLSMDCDFQHLLPEFRDLFDGITKGCDVVIGSRFSRHSVLLNYPFLKILANRLFHALATLLFGLRLRDVTNNLKIMRREVIASLRLRQPGFAVNAETGLQPILLGYQVRLIPISWINRSAGMGTSSFNVVKVGGGYCDVLLGLWFSRIFGRGPYRDFVRKTGNDRTPRVITE